MPNKTGYSLGITERGKKKKRDRYNYLKNKWSAGGGFGMPFEDYLKQEGFGIQGTVGNKGLKEQAVGYATGRVQQWRQNPAKAYLQGLKERASIVGLPTSKESIMPIEQKLFRKALGKEEQPTEEPTPLQPITGTKEAAEAVRPGLKRTYAPDGSVVIETPQGGVERLNIREREVFDQLNKVSPEMRKQRLSAPESYFTPDVLDAMRVVSEDRMQVILGLLAAEDQAQLEYEQGAAERLNLPTGEDIVPQLGESQAMQSAVEAAGPAVATGVPSALIAAGLAGAKAPGGIKGKVIIAGATLAANFAGWYYQSWKGNVKEEVKNVNKAFKGAKSGVTSLSTSLSAGGVTPTEAEFIANQMDDFMMVVDSRYREGMSKDRLRKGASDVEREYANFLAWYNYYYVPYMMRVRRYSAGELRYDQVGNMPEVPDEIAEAGFIESLGL